MKKKVVSLLLAAAMTTAALAGCGSSNGSSSSDASTGADSTSATSASASTDGEKKDAAGEKIAMITDSGDITDESFNQITWETVCAYGDANGVEYEYYKPAEDTDEERINSIDLAVSEGATVVVMPGYLFGPAIAEEQAGYLAGYAAVKDGYTSLGFLGGIAVPAVIRFGYGYVQGINAAAEEDGVDVNVKYYYGGQFYGDDSITARMEGWYADGTQVVFACGGGIWTSALDAAETHDGKVIGVDVDQRSKIGERCLTSAMKGLPSAINNALDSYFSGNFSELGGTAQQLGLKDGDYIGLPTDSESWGFTTFTQDQYETVLAGIRDGSIEISSDTENQPEVGSHVTVDYIS